jgi:RimJ/RimL family protein N-acetyltransferase
LQLVSRRALPGLFAVHSDEAVCRYLPFATWQRMDDADTWYGRARQRHEDGDAIQWAISSRDTGAVLGMCLLFNYEQSHARAELGYSLGRPYWGLGFAREAVSAVIAHGFDVLDLHRLEARVDPRNSASAGLLQRLGFVHEGRLRRRDHLKDERVDVDYFGLLRLDWVPV